MKNYDCYIASGWFNPEQAKDLENIKIALDELNIKYFSPKDEVLVNPTEGPEAQERAFKANTVNITNGKFIIVNTRDKDLGTIFEAGYAYASGVPIIYYCEGLRGMFNLMLSRSGRAVATNIEELKEHVIGIMSNNDYYIEYDGTIE
tara:strand:+ start:1161 stop:1601 length:441 start_codon:yes stop_codon:yes gene_type:complete